MAELIIALLVALSQGATDVRIVDTTDVTIIEYTAPQCPTFEDEACYVIVQTEVGVSIETGP
jgi:hypothetical protein